MAEQLSQTQAFRKELSALKDKFEPLLKQDTDKFLQIAANYVEANADKLLAASRPSLYSAIMKAAQCHLFIDGSEASLVPFKQTVTMMTGYKGILKMVRNSGELASINANVVYENDEFNYWVDEKGEHITHKPLFKGDRGKPVQTYCIARIKENPEPYIEVMAESDIESCKKQSASVKFGGDTPWNGPFADEMRKKTVIRRISKRLPMSTDFQEAIHSDDVLFDQPEVVPVEEAPVEAKTTSSKLAEAVRAPASSVGTPVAEMVEGAIEELKILKVKVSGQPKDRFYCRIGDTWYGTFDQEVYKSMAAGADNKSQVRILFIVKTNKDNKQYNDVLNVLELPSISNEEVPI